MKIVVGYCRTSSQVNMAGDSYDRQVDAITKYAKQEHYQIKQIFYDVVSGTDQILDRPKFAEMVNYCQENGITTILCESPDRFARDTTVSILGHQQLQKLGITLIPVSTPDHYINNDPHTVLLRTIISSIAQFDKSQIVNKLAMARKRKKSITGRCEGRKFLHETAPEATALARKLASVRKRKPSLRKIAMALQQAGYVNAKGKCYDATSIQSMIRK